MSTMQEEHESNPVNMASSSDNEARINQNVAPNEAQDEATEEQKESITPDKQQESSEELVSPTSSEAVAEKSEGEEEENDSDSEVEAEEEEDDSDSEVEVEEEEDDEETIFRRKADALVDEIVEKLEEPNIFLTRDVVYTIGIDECREYLERTLKIEEEGGVVLSRGNRRRTPGGIFFWLVKEDLTKEQIRKLFPLPKRPVDKAKRNAARKARKIRKQAELLKEMTEAWASRGEVVKDIIKSKNYGKAGSIKVTMIGRPGKIIKQKGFIMTTMRGPGRSPSLPKELPDLEPSKLLYLVYVGNKQWKRVAKAIRNPEDILIIEGYLGYEKALKKMVIYSQMVTTKLIQEERREKQRLESEKKKALEAKAQTKTKSS